MKRNKGYEQIRNGMECRDEDVQRHTKSCGELQKDVEKYKGGERVSVGAKGTEYYKELGVRLQRRGAQGNELSQSRTKGYSVVCWGYRNLKKANGRLREG